MVYHYTQLDIAIRSFSIPVITLDLKKNDRWGGAQTFVFLVTELEFWTVITKFDGATIAFLLQEFGDIVEKL
jgi:hypothetical protein